MEGDFNMEQFIVKLKTAIETGKSIDYGFDGENEYAVETFDSDYALHYVVELLKEYKILPDTNH